MVYASKKCRGVGQYRGVKGTVLKWHGSRLDVFSSVHELRCVDHELSLSLPQWLTRGPLCDANFAVSTVPPSGHGRLTGPDSTA